MIARSDIAEVFAGPIPARAGIGLRAAHHVSLVGAHPPVGWIEAHSENYFAEGGEQLAHLAKARDLYPLSLHGVGLSLGSADPLDREHLRKLKRLVQWSQPALVSEHLSWGSIDGTFLNDLLPLPYTREALDLLCARVDELQEFLGRQVLIENISSYLQFDLEQMPEVEFLCELAQRSGCGLLIDVNNVYVNACNHRFDALRYLAAIPARHVQELHLAGHIRNRHEDIDILIDTHCAPVCDAVWALYADALRCFGPKPTLVEWDAEIPALDVLVGEAAKADRLLRGHRARAA